MNEGMKLMAITEEQKKKEKKRKEDVKKSLLKLTQKFRDFNGKREDFPAISEVEVRTRGNRRREFQPTEHLRGRTMAAAKTLWEDTERKRLWLSILCLHCEL